jgi:hypothetical protein
MLVRKLEMRGHMRPMCVLEDYAKMDITELENLLDWLQLSQDRVQWWAVVNMVMNIPVSFSYRPICDKHYEPNSPFFTLNSPNKLIQIFL